MQLALQCMMSVHAGYPSMLSVASNRTCCPHMLSMLFVSSMLSTCSPCYSCCPGTVLHKSPLPRDLAGYVSVASDMTRQLRQINPAGISADPQTPYMLTWLIRSHLYAELYSRGIKLAMSKHVTVNDFVSSFPDASSWTTAFARATTGLKRREAALMTVFALAKMLKYTHPIEMMTCLFCTFGHPGVVNTDTAYLKANCEALRAYRIEHKAKSPVEMHPATLIKSYSES